MDYPFYAEVVSGIKKVSSLKIYMGVEVTDLRRKICADVW